MNQSITEKMKAEGGSVRMVAGSMYNLDDVLEIENPVGAITRFILEETGKLGLAQSATSLRLHSARLIWTRSNLKTVCVIICRC